MVPLALYNITADPYEHHNLADKFPHLVDELQARVDFYQKTSVPPANTPRDPRAKQVAKENGAWTPWL